jgi:arginine exporter protein ArgO
MKYLQPLLRICLHSLVGGTFVLALHSDVLQAQSVVKPSAIPTDVTPVRQAPKSMMPTASPTEQLLHSVSHGVATGHGFSATQGPVRPFEQCGHWIVTTPLIWSETVNSSKTVSLQQLHYSWCSPALGFRPQRCEEEVFMAEICGNSAPICFIVHGGGYSPEEVVKEAPWYSRDLRKLESASLGLNIVFISWPSDTLPIPVEILAGRQSAQQGRHFLAPLLTRLAQQKQKQGQGQNVCLIGHSYGARAVLSALHWVALNEAKECWRSTNKPLKQSRYRAVLIAAAVDHYWLNPDKSYDMALARVECLLNIFNRRDPVLKLYSIRHPWASDALGRTHLEREDFEKIQLRDEQDAKKIVPFDATSLLMPHLYIDAKTLIGTSHAAQRYSRLPEIGAAIRPFVYFIDEPIGVAAPPTSHSSPGQTLPTLISPQAIPGQTLLNASSMSMLRTPNFPSTPGSQRRAVMTPSLPKAPRFPDW